jgi:transcriptional regulator with XRE-family HTH domain
VSGLIRLKQALDARGITQKSCAELLGITEKTLYNKMVGASEFTYNEVKRLRAFLPEYNIDYLLAEDQGA